MLRPRFFPLVWRQIARRPLRSGLTVAGIAIAIFLFAAIQAMQAGLESTIGKTARETELIVFQSGRFCSATSRLPEHYGETIAGIFGVTRTTPVRIVVSNCRAGLDVVTLRGVPANQWASDRRQAIRLVSGSLDKWLERRDAALVGRSLAQRRGLKIGDEVEAAGVRVFIAGILDSDDPQDLNVAYTHLDYLQRQGGSRQLGFVTQFNVTVDDPARLEGVAEKIDQRFAAAEVPTATSSQRGFIARAAGDAIHLIAFSRYVGWGSLLAVLALIANALVLSVQDRIKDYAVFQTLGFSPGLLARLIVMEGLLLGLLGGLLGTGVALWAVNAGQFALSSEGFSIAFTAAPGTLVPGIAVAALLGAVAGLAPAWQASRLEIAACFRAV